jgi:hypothetical protein
MLLKSEWTERKFREKIRYPYGPHGGKVPQGYEDNAVVMAREAGLEFAPEPEPLADRLVLNGLGEPSVPLCCSGEVRGLTKAEARAARDRYNAYPVLRAALAELTRQARGLRRGVEFPPFAEAIEVAEVILARALKDES